MSMSVIISEAGLKALQRAELRTASMQVLLWFIRNLDGTGQVVELSTIQNSCNIPDKGNASKRVKSLLDFGFIRRKTKIGTSYHYSLNSTWFQLHKDVQEC